MSVSVKHIDKLCQFFSIQTHYQTLSNETHLLGLDSKIALLKAMDIELESDMAASALIEEIEHRNKFNPYPTEIILKENQSATLVSRGAVEWEIIHEANRQRVTSGHSPQDMTLPPLGYGIYFLNIQDEGEEFRVLLLVEPDEIASVQKTVGHERLWGINAALYGLKSSRNMGIGDFEDLRQLLIAADSVGAAFVGLNPLHALGHSAKQTISPYSPTHRRWLNTDHLAVDKLASDLGLADAMSDHPVDCENSAARTEHLIDYPLVRHKKYRSLERLFFRFIQSDHHELHNDFLAFKARVHGELRPFSLYETLAEIYGSDFRTWPRNFHKASSILTSIERDDSTRIEFHRWLQWAAQFQLNQVQKSITDLDMPIGLYLDLAVGARLGGAEHWCQLDACAKDVSLGAPPDELSPEGQMWELCTFNPHKLRSLHYQPFIDLIRSSVRHCKLMRIDHILGLCRSFWIPESGEPGGYVRQPLESLLAILKIEAKKTGTVLIGEDLGLVPQGFREKLKDNGIYGYSVWQFERDDAGHFKSVKTQRKQALSCFSTHDTPTIAGYSTATDINWWHKLGWVDARQKNQLLRERTRAIQSLTDACVPDSKNTDHGDALRDQNGTQGQRLIEDVHKKLAQSSSDIVSIQLDDVLGQVEAQNLPGTVDEHPNWRRQYSQEIPAIRERLVASDIESIMQSAARDSRR